MSEEERIKLFKETYDKLVKDTGLCFQAILQIEIFNENNGHAKAVLVVKPVENKKE